MKINGAAPLNTDGQKQRASRPLRIGILGHVGNDNLGDEAIIAAVVQNIRHRQPNAEIIGFTLNPGDTKDRHGIQSFPITRAPATQQSSSSSPSRSVVPESPPQTSLLGRIKNLVKGIPIVSSVIRGTWRALETIPEIGREIFFLFDSRRNIRELDLLIFAGSHQLNDFVDGPWNFAYNVLKWTMLAKTAGAKVVFLSLGAGPIDTWLGRQFIRRALRRASYRSYRDETAKLVVNTLGAFENDQIVPDLAFSLSVSADSKLSSHGRGTVVGINPLPLYAEYWYITNDEKYKDYIAKLASFADWLVDQGHKVHFIPTQMRVDPAVIADVRGQMITNGKPEYEEFIVEPKIQCLDDLLLAIRELDLVVATRYHGILLALSLHKPVLAIAYHSKSRDLMTWLGQSDHVVDGDDFSAQTLTDRFPFLQDESGSIANALHQRISDFQTAVHEQYDEVFKLVQPNKDAQTDLEQH